MARPRQRRRRKHRGTQAGTIRRQPRSARRGSRAQAPKTPAERRLERMNRTPSWRAAFNRAALASSVFLAVLVLVLKQEALPSFSLAVFMLAVYVPMGYAIDSFIYRMRRRRREQAAKD